MTVQLDRFRFSSVLALCLAGGLLSLPACSVPSDDLGADASRDAVSSDADGDRFDAADVAQDGARDVDSDPDGATDGADDAARDVSDANDAPEPVDPLDPEQAQATFERAFGALGLDPGNASDVRSVWDTPELFEAYLAAWETERGVVFHRSASNKAECAALDRFDDTVPYCGPGCGNATTVAPPCLNRGCFEHDACYAALECRSGLLIDVGLSFSSVTECCDAPLAPSREACAVEVGRGLLSGEVDIADAHLFAAVAAIMVAVEASPLLDAPPDRPPGVCDESYADACGAGELVVEVVGAPVAGDATAQVCATLTRGGRPVDVWRVIGGSAGIGTWASPAAEGRRSDPACLTWTAPPDLGGNSTTEVAVSAEVLGVEVASAPATVALDLGPVSLFADRLGVTEVVQVGQSRSICFTAQRPDGPATGVVVQFAVAGPGSLDVDSRVVGSSGLVCVTYIAPAVVPAALDVVRASVGDAGAAIPVEVVSGVVFEGDAILTDDIGAEFWDSVEVITGNLDIAGPAVVELDRLRRVRFLTVRDADAPVAVRLPALEEIEIDLTVADTTISSSGSNASLTTLELPALRLVGRSVIVEFNPALTQLVLGGSSLRVLGSVRFRGNPVLASVDGVGPLVVDGDLSILSNPVLSSVSVAALVDRSTVGRNTFVSGNGP